MEKNNSQGLKTISPTTNNNQNANNNFKAIEAQKFSTYNPSTSESIRFKKMYWSSKMEISARILLILTSIFLIIFSYFLANNIINSVLIKNGIIGRNTNLKAVHVIFIVIIITIGFNFIFYLPVAIGRNAGTMFNWSIIYIILAIGFFIILEVFCTVLLVINGLIESSVTSLIPIFMALTLVVTVIWLIAACLLIVKSDDIRKQLSVE